MSNVSKRMIVWHKVVKRPLTAEEREKFPEAEYYLDCAMPEDGQEVLVSTMYGTSADVCGYDYDGGYFLWNNGDWDDVIAWAEMPKYGEAVKK